MTYARDQRVAQVTASEYRLLDGSGVWTILRENSLWNAYDQAGMYCPDASAKTTPEEAIAAVIGNPR
jgi:hypothetical protein